MRSKSRFSSPQYMILVFFACCVMLVSGCTKEPSSKDATKAENKTESLTSEKKFEDFNPGNFTDSSRIDNVWMPMKPGTRWIYEGTAVEDDGKVVPHRIVVHITDLVKTIGGIRSAVSYDLDYTDNELVEAELAFYAQDNDGTVWRMGEYPEEYEDGKIIDIKPWIHGLEDARAGIMMKAKPQAGTPSYAQGWGPAVDWTDRGKVDQMGVETSVPFGHYKDVLVISETSQSEPNAEQLKYYARDVGNVRVGWRGAGEKTKEVLELVKMEQLAPKALNEVRVKALALEKSAYQNNKNVYGKTSPLEQAQMQKK